MQTYDLDKTQQWLDRTVALNRTPPVRGGLRPDRRLRLHVAGGLLLVACFVAMLLLWPRPVTEARPAHAAAAPAEAAARPAPAPPSLTVRPQAPTLDWFAPGAASGVVPPGRVRGDGSIAPAAPIWLDGR